MLKVASILKLSWKPLRISIRNHPYPTPFIHYLQNLPQVQMSILSNGLKVATEERECYNACVGLFIDGGSRYEDPHENGIAHFFEHIAFKSTKARVRNVLEEQMASTGARFKCYTTREMVVYYAECMCVDVPLVFDILTDCVFNNAFSPDDIEMQKSIVYAEMLEQDQNTEELVFDYLHTAAFQGTRLSQSVMGPSANLYNFNTTSVCRYINRMFEPSRVVLASVGGLRHENMVTLAKTYLEQMPCNRSVESQLYRYTGADIRYRNDNLPSANVAVAVEAPCFCDEDRMVMDVAASFIGGWDRSQAGGTDNSSIVGQSAFYNCDSYKSFNITYKDTGLWGIQFMAPSVKQDDMWCSIQSEFMHLCITMTEGELERAKRELKTKLLWETESAVGACHDIGRWVLYNGCRPPLFERICAIDQVSAKKMREVASKYIYHQVPVSAAVGPIEGMADYTRISSGLYWSRM